MTTRDRFLGCLLGLAVGDAVGTRALEFKPSGSFTPITDMMGGGPFRPNRASGPDDTSMALCLAMQPWASRRAASIRPTRCTRYVKWREEGYWSVTGLLLAG